MAVWALNLSRKQVLNFSKGGAPPQDLQNTLQKNNINFPGCFRGENASDSNSPRKHDSFSLILSFCSKFLPPNRLNSSDGKFFGTSQNGSLSIEPWPETRNKLFKGRCPPRIYKIPSRKTTLISQVVLGAKTRRIQNPPASTIRSV